MDIRDRHLKQTGIRDTVGGREKTEVTPNLKGIGGERGPQPSGLDGVGKMVSIDTSTWGHVTREASKGKIKRWRS